MKKPLALATALTLTLGLAACGQSGSSSSSSATSGGTDAKKTVASTMTFGGPAEFKTRRDGIDGLKSKYGVSFGKVVVTDTGGPVTVNQLKNGQIQVANLFSTDPSIKANDFVALEDPKNNFAAQNVTPIITKSKANDGVKRLINQVSEKLTTDDLMSLVGQVQNDHKDAAAVAKAWIDKAGIKGGSSANGVTLTVGSANFPENKILASIYSQVLKANGANITEKFEIGSREKYFPALKAGSIDLFPEYNGVALSYLDKNATATSQADVDAALAKALPSNLEALKSSPAEDSDTIVVTKATAEKFGLKTIEDLAKASK